jgi:glutathione S-transferase
MAKLKIYGAPQSRAARAIWCANELGLDFEVIPVAPADAKGNADVARLNPNGKVPVIDDNGTVLWESMAINLYLAAKHGGASGVWPAGEAERAQCIQWSQWVMAETEGPLLTILLHKFQLRPAGQNPTDEEAAAAKEKLIAPLAVLNKYLEGREYLVGNQFSIADLNVCSVLNWAALAKVDLSACPNVQQWMQRCASRPSAQKKAA